MLAGVLQQFSHGRFRCGTFLGGGVESVAILDVHEDSTPMGAGEGGEDIGGAVVGAHDENIG